MSCMHPISECKKRTCSTQKEWKENSTQNSGTESWSWNIEKKNGNKEIHENLEDIINTMKKRGD